jgi:hypothetical protein
MHIILRNSTIASGGDAAIEVLKLLPAPLRWVGRGLGLSPFTRGLTRSMYRAVARRRGWLARFLPDVSPVERMPTTPPTDRQADQPADKPTDKPTTN